MKNVITIFSTLVLLTLISVQSAWAGTTPPVEGAVPMGTFRAQFGMKKSGPDLAYSVSQDQSGYVEATAWMVDGGETVYTVDVNSAQFFMPCGWAKKMELSMMMDMFAQAVIQRGIELGYTHPSPDCQNNITDVYYPTCVKRDIGPECPNLVASPESDYSHNGYTVCGNAYNPLITLVYTICGNSACGGEYQSTCGA